VAPTPDPQKVRAAIAQSKSEGRSDGKLLKVLYLDDSGESVGEWASTQLPEDPWSAGGHSDKALIEPPFPMPQLVFLAEMHPVHSSALEQKAADVTGKGWVWEADDPDTANQDARDEMETWWQSLAPDEIDMRELIAQTWLDVETVGWGLIECARDPQGVIRKLYPVTAHTVKAHKNGFALCQARDSRKVWFRRWGAADNAGARVDVDAQSGSIKNVREKANDLFVIKKPSRRSTWYGIPGYVSAIGWITLALAARDDNLYFFSNRREPRWAIILTGMSEDTEIEEDLRRAFTVDLKQPYRNIMVPVSGKDAKVTFEKLSETAKDGSFAQLADRCDRQIMIAHRVPAERLANSTVGALGGNIAQEANAVYKEGLVEPSQEILNARLRRFIHVEWAKKQGIDPKAEAADRPEWLIAMQALDDRSEREDLDQAVIAFHGDIITLREARRKINLGPLMQPKKVTQLDENGQPVLDPVTGAPVMTVPSQDSPVYAPDGNEVVPELVESEHNDKLFTELPGAASQAGQAGAVPSGTGGLLPRASKAAALEGEVYELLRQSRETHSRLTEMADEWPPAPASA
jgi:PBSX family phage portal protein